MKNIVLKNAIIVDPSQNINSKGSIVIKDKIIGDLILNKDCLLYTSPSPRDGRISRMPSSA